MCFVPLHRHFPQFVCSAQCGCCLQVMLSCYSGTVWVILKWFQSSLLLLLYNMYVSCHRHFFPVILLSQRWSPPLTLQASRCSTFRIMCDVPSIAVFCSESIECFPGIVSKFFFKILVTIPVAPIITGTILHFRFHIRCISIHKLLYFIILITLDNKLKKNCICDEYVMNLFVCIYEVRKGT